MRAEPAGADRVSELRLAGVVGSGGAEGTYGAGAGLGRLRLRGMGQIRMHRAVALRTTYQLVYPLPPLPIHHLSPNPPFPHCLGTAL